MMIGENDSPGPLPALIKRLSHSRGVINHQGLRAKGHPSGGQSGQGRRGVPRESGEGLRELNDRDQPADSPSEGRRHRGIGCP